jgi:ATP-dependent DNA helicase RecG
MGAPTQIRVYDSKLFVWNDGALPEGITLDALKGPHSSKPRNPIIADVCFKGGYIDSWGSGTIRIITTCKDASLPEPELAERDGGFIVTLYKNQNTDNKVTDKVTDNQNMILDNMAQNQYITTRELSEKIGISVRKIKENIAKLKNMGLIERIGSEKSGHWKVLHEK